MAALSESVRGELSRIAKELDAFAKGFEGRGVRTIPCWLIVGDSARPPTTRDVDRTISVAELYRRHPSDGRCRLWVYEEDAPESAPILDDLNALGAKLGQLSDNAKAVVYEAWCPHCLQNTNATCQAIDALFPRNAEGFLRTLPDALPRSVAELRAGSRISFEPELAIPDLAKAATKAAQRLAMQLRSDPKVPDPPADGLCCSVARDEERARLKRPKEILPRIDELRDKWARAQDFGPSDPQQELEDLWADMIRLGWELPPCPVLPEVKYLMVKRDTTESRALWREYHAALSLAKRVARPHTPDAKAETTSAAVATGNRLGTKSVDEQVQPANLPPFEGGVLAFYDDRIELCGVDICSGPRSGLKRSVLELLARKDSDGSFVAYSGQELAAAIGDGVKPDTIVGAVRDIRISIVTRLKQHANLVCERREVIESGGRGYQLPESISVQSNGGVPSPEITDIGDEDGVRDVPNQEAGDVRNVRDQVSNDGGVGENDADSRRAWILSKVEADERLQAPDVARHFGCSVKTAQRDLGVLKEAGKVEFVGAPRTGHYRRRRRTADDA